MRLPLGVIHTYITVELDLGSFPETETFQGGKKEIT